MKRWFLLLGLAGCSITLSGPDPNRPRASAPRCDSGKGLVVLDSVLGTVAGLVAIGVAGAGDSAALVPAAMGVAFIAAAVHGNMVVDSCRAANDEFVAQMSREPRAPIIAEFPEPQPVAQPMIDVQPRLQPVLPQSQPAQPQPAQPPAPSETQAPMPWAVFWKEVR